MPNTRNWVDFRQVRQSVDFAEVLEAYGVTLKLRGDQHQGFCPLPDHEGKRRSPSFSANLAKKAFHCFGCESKGNAIDFVALMEGLDPNDPQDIREAALMIQERFLQETGEPPPRRTNGRRSERKRSNAPRRTPRSRSRRRNGPAPRDESDQEGDQSDSEQVETQTQPDEPDNRPRIINAPLDFELKGLDPSHPYLEDRGLTAETIQTFGLGFCGRGMMANRIAIPLHDPEGKLIGYAGRIVDDSLIDEDNPKYRLPGTRERDGKVFEFSKSEFLFNGHRISDSVDELIIVEGFFDAIWLHQWGWENVVALMGTSCSPEQAMLIFRMTHFDSRIWIMTDGDDAGERCAASIFSEIAPERFVHWVKLDPDTDPADYDQEALHEFLDLPVRSHI